MGTHRYKPSLSTSLQIERKNHICILSISRIKAKLLFQLHDPPFFNNVFNNDTVLNIVDLDKLARDPEERGSSKALSKYAALFPPIF